VSPVYPPQDRSDPMALVVVGVLSGQESAEQGAIARLEGRLGQVALSGPRLPFDWTDYYEREMGPGLMRQYLAFGSLMPEQDLVDLKYEVSRIEAEFAQDDHRVVNLDPGYVDLLKVVLASWKTGMHKIYLSRGVWADPVLIYSDGRFNCQDWTFPDLKSESHHEFFMEARRLFKDLRRRDGLV